MKLQPRPKGLKDIARPSTAYDWAKSATNPDKGQANGSCNRTACQAPLADEPEHQFMSGNFTGGPRLHYCARCARDFDQWDRRSGDPVRIQREAKV